MKKILFVLLVFLCVKSYAQPNYTTINSRYNWLGGIFKALHVPVGCGGPALKTGQWNGDGAMYMDTCFRRVYIYWNSAWYGLADTVDINNARLANLTTVGIRWYIPSLNGIRNFNEGLYITGDTTFLTNTITVGVDTSLMFPAIRETIATGGADSTEMDIYGWAGQSNMVGKGLSAQSPTVVSGKGWQYNPTTGLIAGNDPLGTGANQASTGSAGPAFMVEYYKMTGRTVCLVPYAVDGSSQANGANIGSGTWDSTQALFDTLVARINLAITAARAAGYRPVFRGIIWGQGETDATKIADGTIVKAHYKNALTNMLRRLRIQLGSRMPFYIVQTGIWTNVSNTYTSQVWDAQDEVCLNDSLNRIVYWNAKFWQKESLLQDAVHGTQPAYNDMGYSIARNILSSQDWGFQKSIRYQVNTKDNVYLPRKKTLGMADIGYQDSAWLYIGDTTGNTGEKIKQAIKVRMLGTNGTSNQPTFAGWFENRRLGTNKQSNGIYAYGIHDAVGLGYSGYFDNAPILINANEGVFITNLNNHSIQQIADASGAGPIYSAINSSSNTVRYFDFYNNTSATTVAGHGGVFRISGESAAGTKRSLMELDGTLTDATNGDEDASVTLKAIKAGTVDTIMSFSSLGKLTLPEYKQSGFTSALPSLQMVVIDTLTGDFYKKDISTGGSGTPAGNSHNVQLNRSGAFSVAASDSLSYQGTGLQNKGFYYSTAMTQGRLPYVSVGGQIKDTTILLFDAGNASVKFPTSTSATTPSIASHNDANSGISLYGSDNLAFIGNSIRRLAWDNANVTWAIGSNAIVGWVNTTDAFGGAADIALIRASANNLRVTNGFSGGYGGLQSMTLRLAGMANVGTPDSTVFVEGGTLVAGSTAGMLANYFGAGTYTPTLTGVTNITSTTVSDLQYSWVLDPATSTKVVTVSGKAGVTPTSSGSTVFGVSLPVASAFANTGLLAGTGREIGGTSAPAIVYADTTNGRAEIKYVTNNSATEIFFHFTYKVTPP